MVWPRFVWREIGVGRTLSGWYQRVYIHCSLFKDYAIPKMGIRELEVEEDPLIRWIHQLVSSGGLILLSLNYQYKGTKTTVTLLAHMSHHHHHHSLHHQQNPWNYLRRRRERCHHPCPNTAVEMAQCVNHRIFLPLIWQGRHQIFRL